MSTAVKIWLVIGLVLILIGGFLFVSVMAKENWNFSALGDAAGETRTFEIKDDFENISIRSDTARITFVPSADGTCRVEFHNRSGLEHSASVQDGTLNIETKDTRKWYESISVFTDIPKLTIWLPQGEYESLLIDESTGDIEIPGEFSFGRVGITASTGDVDCFASASGQIRIETSTGHIRLENLSAGALALSVSTGRVEVGSVSCAGEVSVRVSTGKASLTDLTCGSLVSAGSTGDISLKNVIAEETVTIERSTGDVKLERCDAAELFITTDTGDVTGTLLSEKVFIAQSDTGRVDVPETVTGGKCKITTDTGKIRIRIG